MVKLSHVSCWNTLKYVACPCLGTCVVYYKLELHQKMPPKTNSKGTYGFITVRKKEISTG